MLQNFCITTKNSSTFVYYSNLQNHSDLWKQACTENSLSLNPFLSGAAEERDFTNPCSNFLHELIALTGSLIIVKVCSSKTMK
jgi:hypothetical protein